MGRPTTAYLRGAHAPPFFSLPPSIEGRREGRLCTGVSTRRTCIPSPCRGSSGALRSTGTHRASRPTTAYLRGAHAPPLFPPSLLPPVSYSETTGGRGGGGYTAYVCGISISLSRVFLGVAFCGNTTLKQAHDGILMRCTRPLLLSPPLDRGERGEAVVHRRKYDRDDSDGYSSLSWVFLSAAFYGIQHSSRPTTAYLRGAHAPPPKAVEAGVRDMSVKSHDDLS